MEVSFSDLHAGMAQQSGQAINVSSVLEVVNGKGVSEGVGRYAHALYPRPTIQAFEKLVYPRYSKGSAIAVEKHVLLLLHCPAMAREVTVEDGPGLFPHTDLVPLGPFAVHLEVGFILIEGHVVESEAA